MTGKKGEVFYMEILLIESNHLLRHSILGRLAEDGYQVTTALTGTKALQLLDAPRYDTILLDTALPTIGIRRGLARPAPKRRKSPLRRTSGTAILTT